MSASASLVQAPGAPRWVVRSPLVFVTGGKGGVGKTLLAANLALELVRRGRRVLLADLDLALSNLNVLLRLPATRTLESFLARGGALEDALVRCARGLDVLPAASGSKQLAQLDGEGRARLLSGLEQLSGDYDLVLADGAAGIGTDVLSFASAADHVLLVTTPEPTAITDAYGLIKALHEHGEETGREVPTPELVVNLAAGIEEAEATSTRLRGVCERFLARSPRLAGWMPRSAAVARSVERQQPFADGGGGADLDLPLSCLKRLAARVERLCPGPAAAGAPQGGGRHGR